MSTQSPVPQPSNSIKTAIHSRGSRADKSPLNVCAESFARNRYLPCDDPLRLRQHYFNDAVLKKCLNPGVPELCGFSVPSLCLKTCRDFRGVVCVNFVCFPAQGWVHSNAFWGNMLVVAWVSRGSRLMISTSTRTRNGHRYGTGHFNFHHPLSNFLFFDWCVNPQTVVDGHHYSGFQLVSLELRVNPYHGQLQHVGFKTLEDLSTVLASYRRVVSHKDSSSAQR